MLRRYAQQRARQSLPKSLLVYSPSLNAASDLSTQPPPSASAAPGVVLDSNVLLDWFVFDDPDVAPLVQAIHMRSVRWLTSDSLRAEMADVLQRSPWRGPAADTATVWRAHADWAEIVPDQAPSGAATRLRCRDPDDQKFIDLALMHGARWLVSRDKAVLALARRARPLGLIIAKPTLWPIDTEIRQA